MNVILSDKFILFLLLLIFPLLSECKPHWGQYYSSWITTEPPNIYNPHALQYLEPRGGESHNNQRDNGMPRWLDPDTINRFCNCIPLQHCPAAVAVLKRTPADNQELEVLRRLTCSFQGFQSSVCCNILIESLIYIRNKKKRAYFSYGGYGGRGGGYNNNNDWNNDYNGYNRQPQQPNYDIDERNINSNGNNDPHIFWDNSFFPRWSQDPTRTSSNGHNCEYPHHSNNNKFNSRKQQKRPKTTTTTDEPYIIDVVEPVNPEPRPDVPESTVETVTIPPVPIDVEAPVVTDPAPVVTDPPPVVTIPPPVVETTAVAAVDIDVRSSKRTRFSEQICGTKIESRIVGGEDAKLGDYPWMVRLGYRRNAQDTILFRCGGTLINNRYVLTAAHCTINLPAGLELVVVRLGEFDERSNPDCADGSCADPPLDVNLENTVVHTSYNVPRLANDIALIRLANDVRFSTYISPLCLPFPGTSENLADMTGLLAVVAGWGSTNTGFTSGSPILRWVRLRIIPTEECISSYRRFNITISTEQQICTGGLENMDACEGDSGGPLFLESSDNRRATLVGIVSFGARRCGTAAVPGVYTRVENYLDWILDTIT